MIDLSSFSKDDLHALKDQINKELKDRETKTLDDARTQILAIAESVGVPLDELMAAAKKAGAKSAKSQGTKAPVKYRHPDDTSKAWTGRGRQPGWVKEWIEGGKELETLRIA